jgi:hypothetical protein
MELDDEDIKAGRVTLDGESQGFLQHGRSGLMSTDVELVAVKPAEEDFVIDLSGLEDDTIAHEATIRMYLTEDRDPRRELLAMIGSIDEPVFDVDIMSVKTIDPDQGALIRDAIDHAKNFERTIEGFLDSVLVMGASLKAAIRLVEDTEDIDLQRALLKAKGASMALKDALG